MAKKDINKLVFEHLQDLYQIAHRLCNDSANAQDLTHDLFIHLNKSYGDKKHHVENARAWLTSIMYRIYIDNWRKEKRHQVISDSDIVEQHGDTDNGPLRDCIDHEQQELLYRAIYQLSEDYRDVVIFHDIEGFTLIELEKIMHTPVGTLKSRLHRARRLLHGKLNGKPKLQKSI